MPRFLADENFNMDLVHGLRRRLSSISIVRVQELGLSGSSDSDILQYAANREWVVLTHDVNTMTKFAHERIAAAMPMPGVVIVPDLLPVGRAIDDLALMVEGSRDDEWENQVRHLPIH